MPKDLMKEMAEMPETGARLSKSLWSDVRPGLERGVNLAYDIAAEPVRASERLWNRLWNPPEVTGPPTLGKAVGAVSDVVTDVASMVPGMGEEAIAGKILGTKIAKGVGVAAITKEGRRIRWKELLLAMKKAKRGSKTLRRTLEGIKRLEKNIPQTVWDYVEDIEIDPKLGAMGEWAGGSRVMRLNPAEMRPLTTFHETGHAVSSLIMQKTRFGSSLARLRNKWGAITGDMNITHKLMEAGYILDRYGTLPPGQDAKLNKVINLLYKGQPEEIFARTFERAFTEGHNLRQSVKIGTKAVKKTLKQVSRFYDDISGLHDVLKKNAGLQKVLTEVEQEADHLIEWLNNPVFRRIEAEYKIGQILEKRGYGTVTQGTKTVQGDIMDIVGGWSFHNEKDLRAIAGMLDEGKSLRTVQKKFPPTTRNVGDSNWLDDQYRLTSTLIYGDEPGRAIENIMKGIDAGGSGMIRSEKIPARVRDVTKEFAR